MNIEDKWLTIKGVNPEDTLPTLKGTMRIDQSGITPGGTTTIDSMNFIAGFDGHDDPWDSSHNNSIFIRNADDSAPRRLKAA